MADVSQESNTASLQDYADKAPGTIVVGGTNGFAAQPYLTQTYNLVGPVSNLSWSAITVDTSGVHRLVGFDYNRASGVDFESGDEITASVWAKPNAAALAANFKWLKVYVNCFGSHQAQAWCFVNCETGKLAGAISYDGFGYMELGVCRVDSKPDGWMKITLSAKISRDITSARPGMIAIFQKSGDGSVQTPGDGVSGYQFDGLSVLAPANGDNLDDLDIANAEASAESANDVICDRTGFKVRPGTLKKQWDGLMVRGKSYDSRHPQDFVRAPADVVKGSPRPEQTDQFISDVYGVAGPDAQDDF